MAETRTPIQLAHGIRSGKVKLAELPPDQISAVRRLLRAHEGQIISEARRDAPRRTWLQQRPAPMRRVRSA